MARQAMWFDVEKATNQISVNTGSQWNHEDLYRTSKGAWIINSYSAYQGSGESWETSNDQSAVDWLIRNGHEVPEDVKHLESTHEV